MEKKEYISPEVRARLMALEMMILSPVGGGGEDVDPEEMEWY